MNQIETVNLVRISKHKARKIWMDGGKLVVAAVKMWPEGDFGFEQPEERNPADFEKMVNSFCYYNCSNETGNYPAFYTSK